MTYVPITSNDFELRSYEISNPCPGLTPGTALRAVGSVNIISLNISTLNLPVFVTHRD